MPIAWMSGAGFFSGYICSESMPNTWYCFSCSQHSQVQESKDGIRNGIISPLRCPLAKFLLYVSMTCVLCWQDGKWLGSFRNEGVKHPSSKELRSAKAFSEGGASTEEEAM